MNSSAEGAQYGAAWNLKHVFTDQELKFHFCHCLHFVDMCYLKILCFQKNRQMPVLFKLPICLGGKLFQAAASIYLYHLEQDKEASGNCGL